MQRGNAPVHAAGEHPIFIVSRGVGASGEQVVRTALAQFSARDVPLVIVPYVRHREQAAQIVRDAARQGTIVHTLVDVNLRKVLVHESTVQAVVAIDLLGPLLEQVSATLGRPPLEQPGHYRQLHTTSLQRGLPRLSLRLPTTTGNGQ